MTAAATHWAVLHEASRLNCALQHKLLLCKSWSCWRRAERLLQTEAEEVATTVPSAEAPGSESHTESAAGLQGRCPKVVYCTRTHSQLALVRPIRPAEPPQYPQAEEATAWNDKELHRSSMSSSVPPTVQRQLYWYTHSRVRPAKSMPEQLAGPGVPGKPGALLHQCSSHQQGQHIRRV